MTSPHDFGELRSLLATAPSGQAFDAILDLIEAALPGLGEDAYKDRWAPYLEVQLQRWPDPTRRVRKERLLALEQAPTPWAPLVRTLEYATSTISKRRCDAICAATHLAGVTNLDLRGASTSYDALHRLAEGAPFTLESFALRKSTSSGAKPDDLLPLFTSRMLSRLSSLELTGWARFGASSIKTMLEHLPLAGLKTLDLNGTGAGKTGLKSILTCEALAGLERLDLGNLEFGPRQLDALVGATHLTHLTHLGLSNTSFSPASVGDMTAAPHLMNLESLDLGRNRLTPADIHALCAPDLYPNLRELTLHDPLDADALSALLAAECFPHVTSLGLYVMTLGADALEHAAEWPSLQRLTLRHVSVSVESWRALMAAPMCEGLEALAAVGLVDPVGEANTRQWTPDEKRARQRAFMDALLTVPMPPTLTHLDLSANKIQGEHVDLVLAQACTPNLEHLDLSTSDYRYKEPFVDELGVLAASPALGNLRELRIRAIPEDLTALEDFVQSDSLAALRLLWLSSFVSEETFSRLNDLARPHLRVSGRYDRANH